MSALIRDVLLALVVVLAIAAFATFVVSPVVNGCSPFTSPTRLCGDDGADLSDVGVTFTSTTWSCSTKDVHGHWVPCAKIRNGVVYDPHGTLDARARAQFRAAGYRVRP